MQLLKAQNSFEKESSIEKEREREKRSVSRSKEEDKPSRTKEDNKFSTKDDVNFLMQVRDLILNLYKEVYTAPFFFNFLIIRENFMLLNVPAVGTLSICKLTHTIQLQSTLTSYFTCF